jgi:hypothetical protein
VRKPSTHGQQRYSGKKKTSSELFVDTNKHSALTIVVVGGGGQAMRLQICPRSTT